MKRFLALVFVALSQPALAHDWEIVSDYDDTVKIANVRGSRIDLFLRAVLSESFFLGMSELYGIWLRDSELERTPLHFISAGPKQLEDKIEDDLEEEFPSFRLSLRDWSRERDTAAFKLARLQEYRAHRRPLLLLGDDTQHDAAVYESFAEERPVMATYIRWVHGDPLGRKQRSFVTAFDVAAAEFLDGRMEAEDALAVGRAVEAGRIKRLLPSFVSCRGLRSPCMDMRRLPRELKLSCQAIEARLQERCAERQN